MYIAGWKRLETLNFGQTITQLIVAHFVFNLISGIIGFVRIYIEMAFSHFLVSQKDIRSRSCMGSSGRLVGSISPISEKTPPLRRQL